MVTSTVVPVDSAEGITSAHYDTFLAKSVNYVTTDWATADIYVQDLRPENEPSLTAHPRMTELAEVVKAFGCKVNTSLGWSITPPGKACWKLIGIQVRTGAAIIMPLVIGPDGKPDDAILVYEHWQDAPTPAVAPTPAYFRNVVGGWTNTDGVVGFAYSGGGVVTTGGGPFSVWPSNAPVGKEPQYADMLEAIGWLGGTDHFTPSPVFAYVVKPVVVPDPDPDPDPDPTPEPSGDGCNLIMAAVAKLIESLAKP